MYYLLSILQCDGATKVCAVKFNDAAEAEYHAQLLSRSAGIDSVTIIECRDYLTVERTNYERELAALLLG